MGQGEGGGIGPVGTAQIVIALKHPACRARCTRKSYHSNPLRDTIDTSHSVDRSITGFS